MNIMDGEKVAKRILGNLRIEHANISERGVLAIINVGNHPSSNTYIANKMNAAREVGIIAVKYQFDENVEFEILRNSISKIVKSVDGALIQLPLPEHLEQHRNILLNLIPWEKDIDGLSNESIQRCSENSRAFVPATALAVKLLLAEYKINVRDRNVCIIGESALVGKPTKWLLEQMGGKVYTFNKNTGIDGSEKADILIVAAGCKHLVTANNVKKGAVVVDVGFTHVGSQIFGDVNFDNVKERVSYISKVPGGVGPLTVVCLLRNFLNALKMHSDKMHRF